MVLEIRTMEAGLWSSGVRSRQMFSSSREDCWSAEGGAYGASLVAGTDVGSVQS